MQDGGSADQAHHNEAAGDAAHFDPRPTFAGTRNARGHVVDQRVTGPAACAAGVYTPGQPSPDGRFPFPIGRPGDEPEGTSGLAKALGFHGDAARDIRPRQLLKNPLRE